jgi:hypothetical protein
MANYTHPTRVTSTLHAEFSLNFALCLFFCTSLSPLLGALYIPPVAVVAALHLFTLGWARLNPAEIFSLSASAVLRCVHYLRAMCSTNIKVATEMKNCRGANSVAF